MVRLNTLEGKRKALMEQLGQYEEAISGNLTKGQIPPGSGKFYSRITWKEKQKTKIQYVRNEELPAIRKGVKQFSKLKNTVQKIGDLNRSLILLRRSLKEKK